MSGEVEIHRRRSNPLVEVPGRKSKPLAAWGWLGVRCMLARRELRCPPDQMPPLTTWSRSRGGGIACRRSQLSATRMPLLATWSCSIAPPSPELVARHCKPPTASSCKEETCSLELSPAAKTPSLAWLRRSLIHMDDNR
ncbi:hypothetical protein Dimus_016484 [Dionaea muscipula]